MPTESQRNASRANGAKSRGPITEEGKQASSRNSLRHGILSKKVVLEGESQEEFDELLASFLEEHQPQTPTERTLVENMVVARWRQERIWNLETVALDHQIRHTRHAEDDDYPTQAFLAFRALTDDTRSLELLNRYEARFDRQFRAALTALLNLRARRDQEAAKEARAGKPSESPDNGNGDNSEDDCSNKVARYYWFDGEKKIPLVPELEPGFIPDGSEPDGSEPEKDKVDNLDPAAPGSFRSPTPIDRNHRSPSPRQGTGDRNNPSNAPGPALVDSSY